MTILLFYFISFYFYLFICLFIYLFICIFDGTSLRFSQVQSVLFKTGLVALPFAVSFVSFGLPIGRLWWMIVTRPMTLYKCFNTYIYEPLREC